MDCGVDIAVERVAQAAHLRAIVPQWAELAREAQERNPCYEPGEMPAAPLEGDHGPECALVWARDPERSDLPAALSALFLFRRASRYRGFPVKTLRAWSGASCADALQCTPLIRAANAHRCVAALLERLERDGVGVVEFPDVPPDGRFADVLAEVLRDRRCTVFAEAVPPAAGEAGRGRRNLAIGLGAVGEMWVSMLPLLANTRRRIAAVRGNDARSLAA